MNRLLEEYEKEHKKEITDENILEKISEANKQRVHIAKSKSGIVVKGINDMAVRFSKCCNPVPGDDCRFCNKRARNVDPQNRLYQYHQSF